MKNLTVKNINIVHLRMNDIFFFIQILLEIIIINTTSANLLIIDIYTQK